MKKLLLAHKPYKLNSFKEVLLEYDLCKKLLNVSVHYYFQLLICT